MSENTISELTKSLETAENKLSSIKEEASDKDDKIKVISDQNKTLTMEKSKILAKLKQQQEDHELQLATQQNLAFKMEAASKTLVKRLDETIYGQKGEIKCLTSQISKLSPKRQGNAEKKKPHTAALGGYLLHLGRHQCTDWSSEGFLKAAFSA